MEDFLRDLEKRLNDLWKNVQGAVWEPITKWEKAFWLSLDGKSKYDWCEDEFKNIQSSNQGKFPKDSFRQHIYNYKKLFEEIKKRD